MRSLETASGTDRGRMRNRNEDAYLQGDSVFAVADGMGGHLAGDVASQTALEPVRALDGKVFPDAAAAQAAMLDAILAANAAVVRKAAGEPGLQGMGTTLTVVIAEGKRLHVGHVGDSRAYLFRNGDFIRLTRDHTLVQHLIEEGQLTEEEAAVHPQRSIITRAIGVDVDLDVDTMTLELEDGDQILLCSDGLSGPVEDDEIARHLQSGLSAEDAVERLIDLANALGGPDNITVVLVRYHEHDDAAEPAERGTTIVRPRSGVEPDKRPWSQALGHIGDLGRSGGGRGGSRGGRAGATGGAAGADGGPSGTGRRIVVIVLVIAALLALTLIGGRWLLSRSYYVGLDGDEIAIYQGVPAAIGPIELSWVVERTGDTTEGIPEFLIRRLEEGLPATDLQDARRIAANAASRRDAEPEPSTSPSPRERDTPRGSASEARAAAVAVRAAA